MLLAPASPPSCGARRVFLGPSCVLTNVKSPRAEISRRGSFTDTWVKRGATLGANASAAPLD
jgi:hypothetical protein